MFNLKKYAQQTLSDTARSIYDTGGLENLDVQLENSAKTIENEYKGNINTTEEAKDKQKAPEAREFLPVYEGVELLLLLKNDADFTPEEKNILIGKMRNAHRISDQSLRMYLDSQSGKVNPQELAINDTAKTLARNKYENSIKPSLLKSVVFRRRNQPAQQPVLLSQNMKNKKTAQIPEPTIPEPMPEPTTILPVEDIGDFISKFIDILGTGDDKSFNIAQSEVVSNVSSDWEQEATSAFDRLREYLGRPGEEKEIADILIKIFGLLPPSKTSGENAMSGQQEEINMSEPVNPEQTPFNLAAHNDKIKQEKMVKEAYTNLGDAYLLYGPSEKRICPKLRGRGGGKPGACDVVSEEICRFHCLDGIIIDDNKTICGEAIYRAHVMDKFSRDYVDKEGNLVGGYINKRFEINRNVPEENKMRLKPGETRKPRPASMGNIESRLQDMRNKEGQKRGYTPVNEGEPFNWAKDVDQNNVEVAQNERDRREEAMGHETVQYTKKDQQENNPKMPKTAASEWTGGWKNGEWKCPKCGTIIGKNLKGEEPHALVRQHQEKCKEKKSFNLKEIKEAKKNGKWMQEAVEDKGSFTEYCGGKVTQECIEKGKKSPDTKTKRRANLAETFREQAKKKKKAFNLKEYKTAEMKDFYSLLEAIDNCTNEEMLDNLLSKADEIIRIPRQWEIFHKHIEKKRSELGPEESGSLFLSSEKEIKEAKSKQKGVTYKGTHYKVNPWSVCNKSTGGKNEAGEAKFERCVKKVKSKSKTSFNLKKYKTAQIIPYDGFADGGEPYTDDEMGPQEDDYTMTPTGSLGGQIAVAQYGKLLGKFTEQEEAEKFIKQHADKNQFWPNVWFIDDHGGSHLVTAKSNKKIKTAQGSHLKTLKELIDATGDTVKSQAGELVVYPSKESRPEYYHLSDYAVSTASGPVLWLVPKKHNAQTIDKTIKTAQGSNFLKNYRELIQSISKASSIQEINNILKSKQASSLPFDYKRKLEVASFQKIERINQIVEAQMPKEMYQEEPILASTDKKKI